LNVLKRYLPISVLLLAGFAARVAAASLGYLYEHDILLYQEWARFLFENGFAEVYNTDFYCNYPPFYLYALYLLGAARAALGLSYLSLRFNMLTVLPAILCDLAQGLFFYKLAEKRISPAFGLLAAAAYVFNPAVVFDSGVWGQVDSVYTLLLTAALYLVATKKLLPSYLIYGAALLTKPQALIVSPVFLYSAYDYARAAELRKTLPRLGLYILCAGVFMLVLALPFTKGFNYLPIMAQYADTMAGRNFASINAFNLHALTGGNWGAVTPLRAALGFTIVAGVVAAAFWTLRRAADYPFAVFFSAALLNTGAFMFSINMHERYLFPTLAFLAAAIILTARAEYGALRVLPLIRAFLTDKRELWLTGLYAAFSVTFLINCASVLRLLRNGYPYATIEWTLRITASVNLVITLLMLFAAVMAARGKGRA
jgi:Gpi18-like mannosyltransferase